jgi:hypothetical protein
MSRLSKIVGNLGDISVSLLGVRLWGLVVRLMTTGVADWQIFVEELDPKIGRLGSHEIGKANDGSQKVHSLSDKQGIAARSQCSCTI